MQFLLVLAILFAIAAVVFAAQNGTPVMVQLFAWSFKSSLALILMITFLLGVLTSLMVSIPTMLMRRRRQSREAKQRAKAQASPVQESTETALADGEIPQ